MSLCCGTAGQFQAALAEGWRFSKCKGTASILLLAGHSRRLLKTSPGQLCVGSSWLQRWFCLSASAPPQALNCSVQHLNTVLETADSLRTKWCFHADCDGQTENERRCTCCLQEPVLCGFVFPDSLLGSAGWSLQASVGNPWLCWGQCLKFCQSCLRLLELCPPLCSPETEWVQANEWMHWPSEGCVKHSFLLLPLLRHPFS